MKKVVMMSLLCISVLFLLANCGKGVIIGKIIDENNDPIIGAQVVTDPPTYSKITTNDGYDFRGLPVGVYTITATKSGYSKKDIEVKVFKSRSTQADIQLKKLSK